MRNERPTQEIFVDPSLLQRFVETAVRTAEGRFEGKCRNRGHRRWCAQGGVTELEERVGPAGEAGIETVAEGKKLSNLPVVSHTRQYYYCRVWELGY